MECGGNQPQEDHANDDVLISIVRGHEILWNSHMKHYRNKQRKDNAWELVAKGMNLSVADVKKDWIRLRTKWGREKRRSKLRPGDSSGEEMTTWPHFKSLSFLQTVVQSRRIASRSRNKQTPTTTASFVHTDVKPQLKPVAATEGDDNNNNNDFWSAGIQLVPFVDDMNVSENCVVEIIQDSVRDAGHEGAVVCSGDVKRAVDPSTVAGHQSGFKLSRPSGNVEGVVPPRSWHIPPSSPEPEVSCVRKRELEDALENSVTGLVKALKTFISQAATNQKVVAKSENELFVQTLAAMLDEMTDEKARKKKAKLFMVCLNEDDD